MERQYRPSFTTPYIATPSVKSCGNSCRSNDTSVSGGIRRNRSRRITYTPALMKPDCVSSTDGFSRNAVIFPSLSNETTPNRDGFSTCASSMVTPASRS